METNERTYTTPTVSMNGTSKRELVEQKLAVLDAIATLRGALGQEAPHGRDYQYAPETLAEARREWLESLEHLDAIRRRADYLIGFLTGAWAEK